MGLDALFQRRRLLRARKILALGAPIRSDRRRGRIHCDHGMLRIGRLRNRWRPERPVSPCFPGILRMDRPAAYHGMHRRIGGLRSTVMHGAGSTGLRMGGRRDGRCRCLRSPPCGVPVRPTLHGGGTIGCPGCKNARLAVKIPGCATQNRNDETHQGQTEPGFKKPPGSPPPRRGRSAEDRRCRAADPKGLFLPLKFLKRF
jgi:hypothetical protein